MFKVESRWNHKDSLHVEWNLGKRCNLDCSYCPAEIHDNYSKHTDISILKKTIDILGNIEKPVRVSLTGGEPCVHPKIEEIIFYLRKKIDWINITTNVTRPSNWYIKQNSVNHWVFSLHFEDDKWQERVEKILNFHNTPNKLFQVNVMAHHDYMNRVRKAVDCFNNNKVPHVLRRIRWTEKHDYFDDMKYSTDDLQWLLQNDSTTKPNVIVDDKDLYHANDLIKKHLNQFTGWTCAAGIESLMINWDGEVYRATCRVGDSLGNIYNGTFVQPKHLITCTRKFCTCAADIPLSKELL